MLIAGRHPAGLRFGLYGAALCALAAGVRAQPAPPVNVDVYARLAVRCLADVPDTVRVLAVDAPASMPYLRPALTEAWRREGRSVYLSDSTQAGRPLLRYRVEEARLAYRREGRRRVKREVAFAVRHSLTAPSGLLLDEGRCRETYADSFPRSELARVQSDVYEEARAEPPAAGPWRRFVEPAALVTAAGAIVYLFFSVRSSGQP